MPNQPVNYEMRFTLFSWHVQLTSISFSFCTAIFFSPYFLMYASYTYSAICILAIFSFFLPSSIYPLTISDIVFRHILICTIAFKFLLLAINFSSSSSYFQTGCASLAFFLR